MELVYLWVEDYKNIKRQGFNFSPRFECKFHDKYDDDGKLEDNCKLEIRPKDYIENFFGDNINITAIVGKNGSGKSSLVKFIRLFLNECISFKDRKTKLISNRRNIEPSSAVVIFFDRNINKFLLFDSKINSTFINKCIIESINFFDINQKMSNSTYKILEMTIFPILDYSLTLDTLRSFSPFYKRKKRSNQFISFPNKDRGNLDFNRENIDVLERIFQNYKMLNETKQWGIFKDFFQPKYVFISFSKRKWRHYSKEEKSDIFDNYFEALIENKDKINIDFFKKIYTNLAFIDKNKEKWEKYFEDIIKLKKLESNIKIFEKLCKKNNNLTEINQDRRKRDEIIMFKFDISELLKIEGAIEYLLSMNVLDLFQIDIIDEEEKKFNELSFGEQQLLKVLNIIYSLSSDKNTNRLVIFLDEVDIGFHPEWQKKVINYILELTKLLPEKEFHLLFSAHSPFIVSDIPKQNIIFLDKDENGNCKVVNGLKEKKQTFGANIHTLLSDSFFMEDGLMGEFAKSKIDKAIKLLNQEHLNEDDLKYCEQIISIIGEPIVKNQLQRMLDSKRLSKIDAISQKIKDMSYELEILKEHQSKIVQDELRDKGKKQYKQRFEDD